MSKDYFSNFPFKPNYVEIDGYKIHYVEEGSGKPILLIHGNPTSSYLWRNIIPDLVKRTDRRVIAMDLLGFGYSDKPDKPYTIHKHFSILKGFIETLELKELTIVGHDWGGPLSVKYTIDYKVNVAAIVVMDTFLWNLSWDDFPKRIKVPFKMMRSWFGFIMIQVMNGFLNSFLPENIHSKSKITKDLMTNYKRPFPTVSSRRAIREFPKLIPVNGKPEFSKDFFSDIEENIHQVDIPFKMLIAQPGMGEFDMDRVKSLEDRLAQFSYEFVTSSGHYMQEDHPKKVSEIISRLVTGC